MYRRQKSSFNLKTLIILGVFGGLLFLVFNAIQSRLVSDGAQVVEQPIPTLAATPAAALPTASAPMVPTLPASYGAIENASLFIPSAGILAPVIRVYLDGTSWDVDELGMNIGHLQGTNWIDDGGGNIVLSGHVEMRDGRQGIFANLNQLNLQDRIVLRQDDTEWTYAVTEIRNVQPDDLTPLYPTLSDQLTLITCDSYDFFSNTYRERVVIVAERIS